jgi:hypothetical protein
VELEILYKTGIGGEQGLVYLLWKATETDWAHALTAALDHIAGIFSMESH